MKKELAAILWTIFPIGSGFGCSDDAIDENAAPVIDQFVIPEMVAPRSRVELRVVAHDLDGDPLTYGWTVNDTKLNITTAAIEWIAPDDEGTVIFQAQISDGVNPLVVLEKVMEIIRPQIDVPDVIPDVDLSKHSVPLDRIYSDTFGLVRDLVVRLPKASAELIDRLRDAIPPIHNPEYEPATAVDWLNDSDVVIWTLEKLSARNNLIL